MISGCGAFLLYYCANPVRKKPRSPIAILRFAFCLRSPINRDIGSSLPI